MTPEQEELEMHARVLKEMLREKRKEVEDLEKRWAEANRKARGEWKGPRPCPARTIVDGWRCYKNLGHSGEHETLGGYKFKARR